jgi:Ser/Thr protein kinase RdoA (MazF antagonist)
MTIHSAPLAADAVLQFLLAAYPLDAGARCEFLIAGLHHNYLIVTSQQRYVCRVYRRSWRSHGAALYELELLDQLRQRNAPVAFPIHTTDQQLAIEIATPSGMTTLALFRFAEGDAVQTALTLQQARHLGEATAQLHQAMQEIIISVPRPDMDLDYLIDASLLALLPHLPSASHGQLVEQCHYLRERIPGLPLRPPWFGPIHGDINLKNIFLWTNS